MGITAEDIVELFEKDVRARRRFAIINAVLRDVATKQDIKDVATKQDLAELGRAIREDIKGLEARLDTVVGELDRLFKLVVVSVLGILMSITSSILVRILLP